MVEQLVEQAGLMTIDEFVRLYETEGPFELINGERRPVSPVVMKHHVRAKRFYDELLVYLKGRNLGEVYFEAAYVLIYDSNWVTGARQPDVMFVNAERLKAYRTADPDWEDKPLVLVPDLVVEVISRNDNYTDVDEKVDLYLADGVKMVLMIDPVNHRNGRLRPTAQRGDRED